VTRRAMVREDFEIVAQMVFEGAAANFARRGEVSPLIFVLKMDDQHRIVSAKIIAVQDLFTEDLGTGGKDMAARIMDLALASGADLVALVVEAWVASAEQGVSLEGELPDGAACVEEVPGRTEAVSVFFRSADFTTLALWPIDRAGKRLVHKPIDWNPGNRFSGRFAGDQQDHPRQ
jgi:hypothetical protein